MYQFKSLGQLACIVIITCLSTSCASGGEHTAQQSEPGNTTAASPKTVVDTSLAKGIVTDSVVCRSAPAQSYALYLPAGYTGATAMPCLYFFDAHARGALPLRKYKNLADKYGFIMIGSNTSKNGMQWLANYDGIKAMMDDSRGRINIDAKQVYAVGFSGGSRVASSVAEENGGIAGVVGCSASMGKDPSQVASKFLYFGIAGDEDFNLTEMLTQDAVLGRRGFVHQMLETDGVHQWPMVADMELALLWLQVNAMKQGTQQKGDTVVKEFKNKMDARIKVARKLNQYIEEARLLQGMVATGGPGYFDPADYKKQLAILKDSKACKDAAAIETRMQQEEMAAQQEIQQQFAAQDEQWWQRKIAELNSTLHVALAGEEMKRKRILSYLSLVAYMYTNRALTTDDMAHAEQYLRIFMMADPTNADARYFKAVLLAKNGNNGGALAALKEAADVGYSDMSQVMNDASLTKVRSMPGWTPVLRKIQQHYLGKDL